MDFVVEEDLRAHLTCWYIQKYVKENPHPHYLEHIIHWERRQQDDLGFLLLTGWTGHLSSRGGGCWSELVFSEREIVCEREWMFGGDKIEIISNCTDSNADVSLTFGSVRFLWRVGRSCALWTNGPVFTALLTLWLWDPHATMPKQGSMHTIHRKKTKQHSNFCYFTCLSSPMPWGPSGAQIVKKNPKKQNKTPNLLIRRQHRSL